MSCSIKEAVLFCPSGGLPYLGSCLSQFQTAVEGSGYDPSATVTTLLWDCSLIPCVTSVGDVPYRSEFTNEEFTFGQILSSNDMGSVGQVPNADDK
jgi:hypothetical protein